MRYFEVMLNGNLNQVAYTLVCKTEKQALRLAKKESKANRNDSFQLFEVDEKGNLLEYCSNVIVKF